jgi:hypothetical protein
MKYRVEMRMLVLRDAKQFDYVPIELIACKYDENDNLVEVFDSLVNPNRDICDLVDVPKHLVQALLYAPKEPVVRRQIDSFVKGCRVQGVY